MSADTAWDREGNNLTASHLLDAHHAVVGVSGYDDEIFDNCSVCGFGAGWVYPLEGGDRFGHATEFDTEIIARWLQHNDGSAE